MTDHPLGSIVFLASGSPAMTVTDHTDDGYIITEWFKGASLMMDAFHPECLRTPKQMAADLDLMPDHARSH